jgi:hypothetical protein
LVERNLKRRSIGERENALRRRESEPVVACDTAWRGSDAFLRVGLVDRKPAAKLRGAAGLLELEEIRFDPSLSIRNCAAPHSSTLT